MGRSLCAGQLGCGAAALGCAGCGSVVRIRYTDLGILGATRPRLPRVLAAKHGDPARREQRDPHQVRRDDGGPCGPGVPRWGSTGRAPGTARYRRRGRPCRVVPVFSTKPLVGQGCLPARQPSRRRAPLVPRRGSGTQQFLDLAPASTVAAHIVPVDTQVAAAHRVGANPARKWIQHWNRRRPPGVLAHGLRR